MASAVSCRVMFLARWCDLSTRVFTVSSTALITSRNFRNETWCKRWWHFSQRNISITARSFEPNLTTILMKNTHASTATKDTRENTSSTTSVTEPSTFGARSDRKKRERDRKSPIENYNKRLSTPSTRMFFQVRNVTVTYQRGLPNITLPLPSRKERCVFTLKPITCTVGDFLDMIKFEDRGVDRAIVTTIDGTRIGSSNTIENLLQDDFKLIINDAEYTVQPPIYQKHTMEDMQKLSDVQILVGQLYETLQVREYHADMERQVLAELEAIKLELEPYEEKLQELENAAMRRANLNAWIWLVLMSMHAGGFARLTWWEYSWDIMEPVTYFVTYGTAVGWFIYFLLTQQEYVLQDVVNRRRLIELHKRAKQIGLDLNAYNRLKDRAYELEGTLKVIRGPLYERKLEMRQKRERYTSSSSRSPSSSPSPSPSPDRDVAKTSIPAKIDKRETSKTLEYDKFR